MIIELHRGTCTWCNALTSVLMYKNPGEQDVVLYDFKYFCKDHFLNFYKSWGVIPSPLLCKAINASEKV